MFFVLSGNIAEISCAGSAAADVGTEYGFDIDDWRAVDRFEAAHPQPSALDRSHVHLVQSEGIRTMRRASAEDAFGWPRRVAARMHGEHIATCAIQPGDQDEIVAGADVAQPRERFGLEHQPRLGRTFVSLPGCGVQRPQARRDAADRSDLERVHAMSSMRKMQATGKARELMTNARYTGRCF